MVDERRLVKVREPQVEDPCGVVKPIGTTVKVASKKVVEKIFYMVAC
jgi:hypothetical protein